MRPQLPIRRAKSPEPTTHDVPNVYATNVYDE